MRPNRYLPIRTLGSGSGGSDLLWHDLILTARLESCGPGQMGAQGGGAVARIRFPWWRLAGVGRSRPFGLGFGRGLAREEAHGTRNTPGRLARVCSGYGGTLSGGGGLLRQRLPVRTRSGCSGSERLRIGTGCVHGAKQAGNRARPAVQGACHGCLRFGAVAGHW
jgi:hypothetical protein